MIDDEDQDVRDPIAAAFADYRRAPSDTVPRTVEHSVEDLGLMADGAQQVMLTHYEFDADGVTKHVEQVTITAPFITSRKENC